MAQQVIVEFKGKVRDLQNKIRGLESDLKKLEGQSGKTNKGVGALGSKIGGTLTSQVAKFGAVIGGAFAIQGIVRSAVGSILEFEDAIASLSAITGATGEDLDFLKKKAIELGASSGLGASETARAFERIGSAKPELLASGEALAEVTDKAIILSQASGLDLVESANALTSTLNQFNLTSAESADTINVLASASKEGAVAIPGIAESIVKFGAVANQANVSLEESVALIEVLGAKGIPASESGIKIRNALVKLQSGADDTNPAVVGLTTALDNLANKQLTVEQLTKQFGLQNVVAVQTLIEQRSEVERLAGAVEGTNVAYEQAEKTQATVSSATNRLKASWEALTLSFDDGSGVFSGALRSIIDGLANLIRPTQEVEKSTLELFQANNQVLASSTALVKEYEDLSKEENLNSDQKARLTTITNDLATQFGASVVEINKETGAISLNIKAIKQQIIQREILQSEQARTLLAQQAQLEVGIANQKQAIALGKVLTDQGITLERLIGSTERANGANISYAQAIKIAEGNGIDLNDSLKLQIKSLLDADFATRSLADQEAQLVDIQRELEASGIDLEAIAKAQADALTELGGGAGTAVTGIKLLNQEIGKLKAQLLDQALAGEISSKTLQEYLEKVNEAEDATREFETATSDVTPLKPIEAKDVEVAKVTLDDLKDRLDRGAISGAEFIDQVAKITPTIAEGASEAVQASTDRLLAGLAEVAKFSEEQIRETFNLGSQLTTSLVDFQNEKERQRTELALRELDKRTNAELAKKGLSEKKKLEIEERAEEERKKILLEQAEREKKVAKFKAIINTARAVAEALPNIPLAILAGIEGGLQVSLIESEPLPQFYKGTPYLQRGNNPKGKDTIPIKANEGERIIPTDQNLEHWDLFEAIRKGNLQDYVFRNWQLPLIKEQLAKGKKGSTATNISNSMKLNDRNLLDSDRRTQKILTSIDNNIQKLGSQDKPKYHY